MKEENVAPWGDMPLYLYESDEDWQGFLSANVEKAMSKGLEFRPLRETILSILNWRKTIPDELKAGITAERWLFFAEAKHVVTLYYGEQAV